MMRATKPRIDQKSAERSRRDKIFLEERAKEQEERAANIARQRALRLAKEASEREAAAKLAAEQEASGGAKTTKKAWALKPRPASEGELPIEPQADSKEV